MEDSGASKVDIVRTTNVCWEYGGYAYSKGFHALYLGVVVCSQAGEHSKAAFWTFAVRV